MTDRSEPLNLQGRHILVVEDEVIVGLDLVQVFGDFGATVHGPATSVREAMTQLDRKPIEGVLADVNLSDGEITPVLERLAAARIPAIIHSGGVLPFNREAFPQMPVLTKPASPKALVSTLARLLEGR